MLRIQRQWWRTELEKLRSFCRACPWTLPLALLSALVMVVRGTSWLFGCLPTDGLLSASLGRFCMLAGITICVAALLLLALHFAISHAEGERNRRLVLSIPLAMTAVYAMAEPTTALFVEAEYRGVLWLAVFALCVMAIYYVIKLRMCRRLQVCALLLGGLFAVLLCVGRQLSEFGTLNQCFRSLYTMTVFALEMAGLFILFSAMLGIALHLILSMTFVREGQSGFFTKKRSILLIAGAMLLCWLPYFITWWPGVLSPDSIDEFYSMLDMHKLSNHQPFIHQLTIKPFLMLGEAVGSLTVGCGAYSLFQMLMMSLIFATAIWYMARLGLKPVWRLLLFGLYSLNMVHAMYSITMWKDVLFAGFTLLLSILLFEEVRAKESTSLLERKRIGRLIGLIVVCFFFCIYRNNGFYAFLLGFPLFLLCNRKRWKRLGVVFLTTVLLVLSYQSLIFDCLGVVKSSEGEALSIPLQQIARTVHMNGESVTEAEYDALDEFFADSRQLGQLYIQWLSDPIKDPAVFKADAFRKNPLGFVQLWLKLGMKCPETYFSAFFDMNFGYWYPDEYSRVIWSLWCIDDDNLEQNADMQIARDAMMTRFQQQRKTPVLSMLHSIGFMVWVVAFAVGLLCFKRKKRLASPMLLIGALWLTTLASPLYCEYRYLYGLIVTAPICLGVALVAKDGSGAEESRQHEG